MSIKTYIFQDTNIKNPNENIINSEKFRQLYAGGQFIKMIKRIYIYKFKYLKYIYHKILRKITKKNKVIKVKTFFDKTIYVFSSESLELILFGILEGKQEASLINFLYKNISNTDVFYDVGANIGYYSVMIKELKKDSEVHSFEPNPTTFMLLAANLANYNKVKLNKFALFNKSGFENFYDATETGYPGRSSIYNELINKNINDNARINKIKTKIITLDSYCMTHKHPTLIKIDTEGSELDVIKGGLTVITESKPIIIMEYWKEYNTSHKKAVSLLRNLGYKVYTINITGELEQITDMDTDIVFKENELSTNLIFKI